MIINCGDNSPLFYFPSCSCLGRVQKLRQYSMNLTVFGLITGNRFKCLEKPIRFATSESYLYCEAGHRWRITRRDLEEQVLALEQRG